MDIGKLTQRSPSDQSRVVKVDLEEWFFRLMVAIEWAVRENKDASE